MLGLAARLWKSISFDGADQLIVRFDGPTNFSATMQKEIYHSARTSTIASSAESLQKKRRAFPEYGAGAFDSGVVV